MHGSDECRPIGSKILLPLFYGAALSLSPTGVASPDAIVKGKGGREANETQLRHSSKKERKLQLNLKPWLKPWLKEPPKTGFKT